MSEAPWAKEQAEKWANELSAPKLMHFDIQANIAFNRQDAAMRALAKAAEMIEAQAKVIEKLKEQRDNLAHDAAYEINYGPHPKEALEKIKELDAELTALTKQPEPKEGV